MGKLFPCIEFLRKIEATLREEMVSVAGMVLKQ